MRLEQRQKIKDKSQCKNVEMEECIPMINDLN